MLLWHEYNVNSGCQCLMMTLHLIVYRAFFTKLCMSKVQYVCGELMLSYKCVTSFGRKAAILLRGYA